MSKIEDWTFYDNLGVAYTFEVYPKGTEFDDVPGVYAFTRRTANQHGVRHKVLYVGKTQSFRYRQLNYHHHKWASATERKFTHICVLPINGKDRRKSIEEMLILKYDPPVNERKG